MYRTVIKSAPTMCAVLLCLGVLSVRAHGQCEPPDIPLTITIVTDSWPTETTWEVIDQATGTVVCNGGPYDTAATQYVEECCVDPAGCYDVIFYDSYGDGIYAPGGVGIDLDGVPVVPFVEGNFAGGDILIFQFIGNCDIPEGACCFDDGSCQELPEAECAALGGRYKGDGTFCIDVECFGACCLPNGDCVDQQTVDECILLGGTYQGDGVLCIDVVCPVAPVNDTCQQAIEAFNGVNIGNNTNSQVDDPDPSCTSSGSSDIWFFYTATDTGSLLIDTCGTYLNPNNPEPVDTVLAVYNDCGGVEFDCDDDCFGTSDPPAVCRDEPQIGTSTRDSCVCIDFIEAETTVWIQIQGFGGDEGEIFLNITPLGCEPPLGACCVDGACIGETIEVDCTGIWFEGEHCETVVCPIPPDNDECPNATLVTDLPFQDLGVAINVATDDANIDPSCDSSFSCATGPANNGVWYQYTPNWDCELTFDQTGIDAATSIWTGDDCDTLTEVFCSDPDPFTVNLAGGVTYWICVSNWSCSSEPAGPMDVFMDCIPIIPTGACCIDDVCTVLPEADCLAGLGQYLGDGTNCDLVNLGGIADPGFEGGTPSADWIEASTNFGTPLCDLASCGFGGGSGPFEADWWCWIGGITGAFEQASAQQDITIDANAQVLRFYFEMPVSEGLATDFAEVQLDGNVVWSVLGSDPLVAPYTPIEIDLATAPGGPYNDGGLHTLLITGTTNSVAGPTNFFFDSLAIGEPFECPTGPDCPYDVTGPDGIPDGEVGTPDFFGLLQSWGPCDPPPAECPYDVTGPGNAPDGEVGTPDFFGLLQSWGPCL